MDGARGAVEILTEFAAPVLLDQRLQRLVGGGARLTRRRAAGGKAATEQAEKGTAVGCLVVPAGGFRHRGSRRKCAWRRLLAAAAAGDIVANPAENKTPAESGRGKSASLP